MSTSGQCPKLSPDPHMPQRTDDLVPRILPVGDAAVLVEFGDSVDPALNDRVYSFAESVTAADIEGVEELVPTYRSLLVQYDLHKVTYEDMAARLEEFAKVAESPANTAPRGNVVVHIPMAYGGEFGPDLEAVADHNGLSSQEVIDIHSGTGYRVFMLGFAPGFPYLGGMDERIACPRLQTPRIRVAAGSVGIAESQTGVYPNASPGGWRIIGRTPVKLFDPGAEPPAAILPGSRVVFMPVSEAKYRTIAAEVEAGDYKIEIVTGQD